MKKEDVPQDDGLNMGMCEVAYARDQRGRYVKVPSLGWEPKNVANEKAWEQVEEQIEEQVRLVREGRKSPLAYYMTLNLMDTGLLSRYMRMSRWRVKRHLKPRVFARLSHRILSRYAQLFEVSVEQLTSARAVSERRAG
jgi:hypothetical protein